MDEIERLYQQLLNALLEQKYQESNRDYGREISIVITQTELAHSYFQTHVKSPMEETNDRP